MLRRYDGVRGKVKSLLFRVFGVLFIIKDRDTVESYACLLHNCMQSINVTFDEMNTGKVDRGVGDAGEWLPPFKPPCVGGTKFETCL